MRNTSIKKYASGMLSVLFLAGAVGGCGTIDIVPERDAHAARMVELSLKTPPLCNTTYILNGTEEMPYRERLQRLLNLLTVPQMEILNRHKVQVCLDQRHASTNRGFFGGTFNNIFYPATKERGPIVTFYDDGREPKDRHMLPKFIEAITESLESGNLPPVPSFLEKREVKCAPKWTCPVYSLQPVKGTGLFAKNPEMANPPLLPQ